MAAGLPKILTAGEFHSRRSVDWHGHSGAELVLVARGSCRITLQNQATSVARQGDMFVLPPHIPHRQDSPGLARTFYIVFDPLAEAFDSHFRITGLGAEKEFQRWFRWICLRHREADPGWGGPIESLLSACLRRLDVIEEQDKAHRAMHPRLSAALVELRDHFLAIDSLEILATRSGASASLLKTLFRKHLGTSPMRYRNQLRMSLAKRLLANPYLRISEVATQCGFADANYFARCFHQMVGVSPGAWKKRVSNPPPSRQKLSGRL